MDNSERRIASVTLHNSTRFFILVLSTICLTLIVCNSVALNFTIICMTSEEEVSDDGNVTITKYDPTPLERGWLFSIISVGSIFGTLTLPFLLTKIEIRKIMTIYGLISSLATLFTPLCASIGYVPLLLMRFLQGFATSMSSTSVGSITSQWSTMKESGFFIAILSTHFQFGNIFTMPIAGALCESRWGWPSLYYLQGTLTAIVSIAFYLFYRDDPYWHGFVSNNELSKIEEGKIKIVSRDGNNAKNKKNAPKKVPYKAIFTDFVVWGTVMGITFIRFGFLLFVQFGPFYLNKVMKLDIKSTGIGSALPHVGSIVLKIIVGQLSDRITCIPMKLNLKLFVTIASLFLVLGKLSLVFITAEYSFLAQIAFIIVVSFNGLGFVGSMKSSQMISQHYFHTIMIFITLCSSCVSLILPIIVAILAPDNTQAQWKVIFIGISIIIFAGTIIFNIVADVEPRKWVKNSSIKNNNLPNNEISIISLPDDEKKSKNDV